MGKPKFSRKKYETPSHPWQEDRIKAENELTKKYGLKNKREIWKAQTELRKYRGQARELLAKVQTGDMQSKKESDQLLMRLNRMNILPSKSTLDDVLALEIESILSRRLQTITYLKGLANTPDQSRQLISHGHIAISNKRVTVPSYMVTKDEEGEISYMSDSPLNDLMHPARPRADFKSAPKKEPKTKETKEGIREEKHKEPQKEGGKQKEEKPKVEESSQPEQKKEENTKPEKVERKTEEPVKEPAKEDVSEKKPEESAGKENKEGKKEGE